MKKLILLFVLLPLVSSISFGWGKTGHRVVGQIAYNHMSKKAIKNMQQILGDEQLGMVGNYMDFIRSDRTYDHMTPWHYCTVPDGKDYADTTVPENGDAVQAISRLMLELQSKEFTYGTELENLKYLVHLIGDIHQPLHVGNGEDSGGNGVKVEFLWEKSNLHRVWDSGLIDHQQLSYSEYVSWIDNASEVNIEQWQADNLMVWVGESKSYREQIYSIPENKKIGWRYNFDNIETVNKRLLKAGIRLAGILNEIYG
jgi:hypothetical protein